MVLTVSPPVKGQKRVRRVLRIPEDLNRKIRKFAAQRKQSVNYAVEKILYGYLEWNQ